MCGAVPSTGELGKMGWCILFSGKEGPLPMARKSSEMLIIPRSPCPLGGEAALAFSGQEGCTEARCSSGGQGFIFHLPRIWL